MVHDISKLDKKMGVKRVAKAKARVKKVMVEILLDEIGREKGFIHEELANKLS